MQICQVLYHSKSDKGNARTEQFTHIQTGNRMMS